MGKEHFPLKAPLLMHQMEQQHKILCKSGRSSFSEEDEHKQELRLLIEFTSGLAQDHLKKTIEDFEIDNNYVKNKNSLELIINIFLTKYLVVYNRHNNLLHKIIHLKSNLQSTMDMLYNLV